MILRSGRPRSAGSAARPEPWITGRARHGRARPRAVARPVLAACRGGSSSRSTTGGGTSRRRTRTCAGRRRTGCWWPAWTRGLRVTAAEAVDALLRRGGGVPRAAGGGRRDRVAGGGAGRCTCPDRRRARRRPGGAARPARAGKPRSRRLRPERGFPAPRPARPGRPPRRRRARARRRPAARRADRRPGPAARRHRGRRPSSRRGAPSCCPSPAIPAAELAAAGLLVEPGPAADVSACAGRPGCAKALADVRADALAALSRLPGGRVHVSGCERRCGAPRAAHVDAVALAGGGYLVDGVAPPGTGAVTRSYVRDGAEIYRRSFATIRAEADLTALPPDVAQVAVRMIHACGRSTSSTTSASPPASSPRPATALRERRADPLRRADGRLGRHPRPAAGGQRRRLHPARPAGPGPRGRLGTTRSAAALELWRDRLDGAVVAIGNAPTALFHLLEMLDAGAPRPAAVLGIPVGFIGAAESKEALAGAPTCRYLVVHGRRGGQRDHRGGGQRPRRAETEE